MARVLVVGAGVIGLTCAVRLLEEGHRVDVLARDLPLETTSVVAAALWHPYLVHPAGRVQRWSKRSYDVLAGLAASDPEAGVVIRPGMELMRDWAEPQWLGAIPEYERVSDVAAPYRAGLSFVTPVVEMPLYLDWLRARVEALGGTVTRMALSALPEHAELVVNATGMGARLMAADASVRPVRGQIVLVSQVGVDQWWLDEAGPTYIVPRSRDIVLGGTNEPGEWGRTPVPETAEAILARATALVPSLAQARILQHRVGLRPARPEVRLERVGDVIHCYGHGGSGVTLSWGCADEVARLVS